MAVVTFARWMLAASAAAADIRARLAELGPAAIAGPNVIDGEHAGEVAAIESARSALADAIASVWVRRRATSTHRYHRDIHDVDEICKLGGGGWRPCRYGFDELVIAGARERMPGVAVETGLQRWRGAGSYLARNCLARELAAVSLQINEPHRGDPHVRAEPLAVMKLIGTGRYQRVEWCWRGRVVHVATADGHRESLDGWDNCVDAAYLAHIGADDLARPAEVYAADR